MTIMTSSLVITLLVIGSLTHEAGGVSLQLVTRTFRLRTSVQRFAARGPRPAASDACECIGTSTRQLGSAGMLRLRGGGDVLGTIKVKSMSGESTEVAVGAGEAVGVLKRKIADIMGFEKDNLLDPKTGMKLIHAGSILSNDKVLDEIVKTKSFVVLMPPKGTRPAVKPTTPTETAPVTPVPSPTTQFFNMQSAATAAAPMAPPSAQSTTSMGTSGSLSGEQRETALREIVSMGFSESDARRALVMAHNDPDRAVDILFTEVPDSLPHVQSVPARNDTTDTPSPLLSSIQRKIIEASATGERSDPNVTDPNGCNGSDPLAFLRGLPHFTLMRQSVQMQPSLLPQLLQQIGATNPSLLSLIQRNQEEFVRLVNEPVSNAEFKDAVRQVQEIGREALRECAPGGQQVGGGRGDENAFPGGEGGVTQIRITREEMDVIERLDQIAVPMGLTRQHVLEAWLTCDKDEVLAANYLIENAQDLRGY